MNDRGENSLPSSGPSGESDLEIAALERDLRALAQNEPVPPGFRSNVLRAIDRAEHRRAPWARFALPTTAGFAVAASALILWIAVQPSAGTEQRQEYAVRGSADEHIPVAFRIFELKAGASSPKLVYDSVERSSGWLFAYSNPRSAGFRWLTIVAHDESGSLQRLIPAPSAGTSASFAIDEVEGFESIHEGVRPVFAPGSIRVVAVFSSRVVSLDALSQWLRHGAVGEIAGAGRSAARIMHVEVSE